MHPLTPRAAFLAFLLICGCSQATELPLPTARMATLNPEPGSEHYPAGVVTSGAQGTVIVRAGIAPDGWLVDPVVEQSSKSPSLDALALAYAKATKLKQKDGAAFPPSILVPIEFRKDTVLTIRQKSCGDFNADLAFARSISPGATAQQTQGFRLATGMLMLLPGIPMERQVEVVRNLKALGPRIESHCASNPEARFMESLSNLAVAR
ncbi:TonB family protein [Montanilutibacter psychrotolerans]|uniref:TonB family protein n=1 Tax=Montanilutibacter psychrotolerans TaxID=1327343 RepID=A0A3M8SY07_9GAMM|nr:TonB family protein [Lysobacter psychrotolerans]RNF83740.1 TonB family protein [Lysobacter psychrotolerans]